MSVVEVSSPDEVVIQAVPSQDVTVAVVSVSDTVIESVLPADTVIESSTAAPVVVEVSEPGPEGPQGPPGAPGGDVFYNPMGGVVVFDDGQDNTAASHAYSLDGDATVLTIVNMQRNYLHTQTIASDTWVIVHPLHYEPNVSLIDSAGTKFYADEIVYTPGVVTAHLLAAQGGTATLT